MRISQREKILELLKYAKADGVNSHDLTYIHGIKQAPTRIHELKQEGHLIVKSRPLKNGSVNYILIDRYEKLDNKTDKPLYKYIFENNVAKRVLVEPETKQGVLFNG